ncbi:hypothetical protein CRENPOLYSF1_1290017 [Crenothrix polyspora]|uniref:Uncharacterized protein n=1 Tax=Crenothrix polyspora TaxID=360316 RepID=A0A1R4H2C7_9GAMM|nr:hypothetical protein CRENPOLYSF1_1290017 [Crenothrix polyspora]
MNTDHIIGDLIEINETFQIYYPGLQLSRSFEQSIIDNFHSHFSLGQLITIMVSACDCTENADHAIRYFCATCWRKINFRENREPTFCKRQDASTSINRNGMH